MLEIKKIYLAHFLVGLATATSVVSTLYLLSHGVSQSQVSLLFAVFMITMALLNMPTGSFADIHGHKKSVFLGLCFHSLYSLFFFLFPTFLGFLVGMAMAGIGLALQDGAVSSLIYDILKKNGRADDFQKVKGRAASYFLVAAIFAAPIGSLVYKSHPRLPYLLSFFCFIPAIISIFSIKWEFKKPSSTATSFFKKISEGFILTIRNKKLVAVALMGIALTTARLVFNQNISQPYQIKIGVDVSLIGFTASLFALVQAAISASAYRISRRLGVGFSLLLVNFVPSICLVLLGLFNSIYTLGFILIFYLGHTFRDPFFSHIGQSELSNKHRATMASTVSFLTSLIVGVLLPVWGHGLDLFGMNTILLCLAIFTAAIGAVGIFIFML